MTTPIAQYLFKDNGNDETGTYNGTPANVTYEAVPAGKNFGGKAAVFNGSSSYIDIGNNFNWTTQNFSFEVWVYVYSLLGTQQAIFSRQNGTTGYYAQYHSGDRVEFYSFNSGSTGQGITNGVAVYAEWVHLVFVRNTTTFLLYKNGTLDKSATVADISTASSNFYIGNRQSTNWLNGKLANFRVYNAALPAAEIAAHYVVESRPASGFFMFM